MTTLLNVCDAIQNNVFGSVLLRMGLLWSANDYVSNLVCAALLAMTGLEGESTVMVFGIFMQLLKPCGAIRNFACFPNALPMGCCFIISQGVAIGLGYAGL
jgi:hypothetical protein